MSNDLYIPDSIFPSDNSWEIPTLRLDVQPQGAEIPFLRFGEQKRTYNMNGCGTLCFYQDDYKFSSVYDHPEKILAHHPGNIVEPNFSLFNETPPAFGLQAVYKKRWIARAMQEKGIGVFVDLNVAQKFIKLNLIGIPRGYNAFATRGYSDRIPALEIEYSIAQAISGRDRPLFVCYGGGADCRAFCNRVGAVYITPIISAKTKERALKQMLADGVIAFAEEDYSVKAIEDRQRQIWLDQVVDFGTDVQHQIEE
jgi:hypothetical protein